jgi:hypothetical protein
MMMMTKPLRVAVKTQEWVPLHCCRPANCFVLLSATQTYKSVPVDCPIILSDCNQSLSFSADFHKESPLFNFTQIRPVGAAVIRAERWTLAEIRDEAKRRFSRC